MGVEVHDLSLSPAKPPDKVVSIRARCVTSIDIEMALSVNQQKQFEIKGGSIS